MHPPISIDLTRLCYGPSLGFPRGIDRVEHDFAAYFLSEWNGDANVTVPTPFGTRCLDRKTGLKALRWAESFWTKAPPLDDDPTFQSIKSCLFGEWSVPHGVVNDPKLPPWIDIPSRVSSFIGAIGMKLGQPAWVAIPEGTVHLSVGHFGLALNPMLSWLTKRRDVQPAFMLHDAIPYDHPELVSASGAKLFRRFLTNAAEYASGVISTTAAARDSVRRALEAQGAMDVAYIALPLAVPSAFRAFDAGNVGRSPIPYFLFCGTMERRKNVSILIDIWKDIAEKLGPRAPRLVIVGPRDSTNEAANAALDTCDALRNCVLETQALSDAALAWLISGARALLSPSIAEGFGLPIVEALTLGTPVLASDIPAHREVGGEFATFINPHDRLGWLEAVVTRAGQPKKEEARNILHYRPRTPKEYFSDLRPFINQLHEMPRKSVRRSR